MERALDDRDAAALDALAETYDQSVPEPDAATRLRRLAGTSGPIVGYLGKLIPQKGVELLLQAHRTAEHAAHALVVGFGSYREWLAALAIALERGDAAGARVAARGPRDTDRGRARIPGRGRVTET